MLTSGGTTIALALTGALLAVVPAGPASAVDPPTCPFPAAQTYTWKTTVPDGSWTLASGTNWTLPTTAGYPNNPNDRGDGPADPLPTYVCIGPNATVHVDSNINSGRFVNIRGMWLAPSAQLYIDRAAVFVDGQAAADESFASPGSLIDVNLGWLGGMGTLRTKGLVTIHSTDLSASTLGSNLVGDGAPLNTGTLHVDTGGVLRLPDFGVNFNQGYRIDVDGRAELLNHGYLGVASDSVLTVEPGGVLEFAGTSGFYESGGGAPVSLANKGTIERSGSSPGSGDISLIGTDYSQTPTADVKVTSGTLAFADGTAYTSDVSGGQQLSTARCGPLNANQGCVVQQDPQVDPQSVAFRTPTLDPSAVVQVTENAKLDFTAHATDLATNPADPAVLTFRLGAGPEGVSTTHPADVQIVHDNEPVSLPDCPAVGLAANQTNCVDRTASSYDAVHKNVIMVVRTIQTSRYVCHKEDATPPGLLAGPAARSVKLGKPITVTTRIDEAGAVTISGRIKAGKLRLPVSATVSAAAGVDATAVLKLTKKQKKKLKRAGVKKGKALLTVVIADSAGHALPSRALTVKLS